MREYNNYYFKTTFEEGHTMISGLPLPDPKAGPYKFVDCELHPRLWGVIRQEYKDSEFVNTYTGPSHQIN